MTVEYSTLRKMSGIPLLASKKLPETPTHPSKSGGSNTAANDRGDPTVPVSATNSSDHPELSERDLKAFYDVHNHDIKNLARSPRSAYDITNEWWLWEFSAWVISLIAMIALVAILNKYNSRALPEWPHNISLNSVMSLFTTVFKSSLLIPVVESISQLKWCLFERTRALQEMEIYDDASRGPYGSLWFLFSPRIGHLASLGALITLLGLAIDPFSQQVVTYPLRSVPADTASVPRIQTYNAVGPRNYTGKPRNHSHDDPSWDIDLSMKAAIYGGLSGTATTLTTTCSTGNCTWKAFSSLSICNRCQDVSDRVSNHTLPNGLFFNDTIPEIGYTNILVASGVLPAEELGPTRASLANFSILNAVQGYECTLYWCVQEYDLSITEGVLNENVTRTWSNESLITIEDIEEYLTFVPANESTTVNGSDIKTFLVWKYSQVTMVKFFKSFFTGSIVGGPNFGYNSTSDAMQAFSSVVDLRNGSMSIALADVPALIGRLTKNINIQMRQATNSLVHGKATKTETYVLVQWQWLSLPIALLVLTLVFLVATIRKNTQKKILPWKSSITTLLLHGLAPEHHEKYAVHERQGDMDAVAKELRIRLQKSDDGWQLK